MHCLGLKPFLLVLTCHDSILLPLYRHLSGFLWCASWFLSDNVSSVTLCCFHKGGSCRRTRHFRLFNFVSSEKPRIRHDFVGCVEIFLSLIIALSTHHSWRFCCSFYMSFNISMKRTRYQKKKNVEGWREQADLTSMAKLKEKSWTLDYDMY